MKRAVVLSLLAALTGCTANQTSRPAVSPAGPLGENVAEMELAMRMVGGRGLPRDVGYGEALAARAADRGDIFANYLRGLSLLNGDKPQSGVEAIQAAAQQGYAEAQAQLAFLYLGSKVVPQDYAEARRWAQASADQGAAVGWGALGAVYRAADNPNRDPVQATAAFRRAAMLGYSDALWEMGRAYATGQGVAADPVLAYVWYDLWARRLDPAVPFRPGALRLRDDASLLLLPDELELARQIAADWKPGEDPADRRAKPLTAPRSDWSFDMLPFPQEALATEVAVTWLDWLWDFQVQPDGGYTLTQERVARPNNEAGARGIGEHPLRYDEQMDRLDVIEAATVKPNGRRLTVPASAIHIRPTEDTRNLPMFSDSREKVVVFPDVQAGDTLILRSRKVHKPMLPGVFSLALPFDRTFAMNRARVRVSVPKSMQLRTETHGLEFSKSEAGDRMVYEWRYTNPNPLAQQVAVIDLLDYGPRLAASNVARWEELGRAYGRLVAPKLKVTPKVQALADEITANVGDRRAQAAALYTWVGRRIRYLAIDLGNNGGFMPHAPDDVIDSGYGDCKDHAALLSVLLEAKGIASEVVLVNAAEGYTLSAPPTLGAFNHAMTYIPEFDVYADSTLGVAPFGELAFNEYGKPVLHAGVNAGIRRIPSPPPGAAELAVKTTARLGSDGKVAGDTDVTASGPFAIALRGMASSIQAQGNEAVAKTLLGREGLSGSGRFAIDPPYAVSGSDYRLGGTFQGQGEPNMLSGNPVLVPVGLWVGWRPADLLAGPLFMGGLPELAAVPCFSGRQSMEVALELPPGKRLREVPQGIDVQSPGFHYTSDWKLAGNVLTVTRRFEFHADAPLCVGERRRGMAEGLAKVRNDYGVRIVLTDR